MKKKLGIAFVILYSMVANAQDSPESEMDKAVNFFKNASVVTYNEDYSPKDYVGSLIYYKSGDTQIKVLKITKPNDSTIVREEINDILYQKMHNKEEVASAKFLGIFSSKVTIKHLLEVILLRDYTLEAESFLAEHLLFQKIVKLSKPLTTAGYNVEFVWKVNVNKLTSRIFKEGDIQVGFNYQVEGSGKVYNKTEDFTKKSLITLQTIDVGIFITETVKSFNNIAKGLEFNSKMFYQNMIPTEQRDYFVTDDIIFDK